MNLHTFENDLLKKDYSLLKVSTIIADAAPPMIEISNSESPMIELVARGTEDEEFKKLQAKYPNKPVTMFNEKQKGSVKHLFNIMDDFERKNSKKKSKTVVQKATKVVKAALKPITKIVKKKKP